MSDLKTSLLETVLSSGTALYLEECTVGLPYLGLLEGKPTPEVNHLILSSHEHFVRRAWPELPVIVLDEISLLSRQVLPEFRHIGRFAAVEKNTASKEDQICFVAVWFEHSVLPLMSDSNLECLRKLDIPVLTKTKTQHSRSFGFLRRIFRGP